MEHNVLVGHTTHKNQQRKKILMSVPNNKTTNTAQGGSSMGKKVLTIAIAVLVVALIAGSFVVNSNYFYTGTTSITVGDTDYTTAEYNYFYYTAYNNFYDSMGDYASYVIDSSLPLDEQYYTDDMSFDDYFRSSAVSQLQWATALYNLAVAEGMSLTDDEISAIESDISMISMYALMYGVTEEQYYMSMYGKGFDGEILQGILEKLALATKYYEQQYDSYAYTSEELAANYAENANAYDMYDYRVYFIESGEDAEAAYATADKIATAKDGDEFAELVLANAPEESAASFTDNESTLYQANGTTLDSYDYGAWLQDSTRVEFETTTIESSSGYGYYVVMFIGRDSNDYNTATVRHILINAVADADGVYTDEAIATAEATAEEILAEFEAGNKTETSFAELATTYSEDTGSVDNGGLYENIYKGQMVESFEEFCFASHSTGDVEIVFSESSYYTGYHIIYYVGEGDTYADVLADSNMRAAEYSEWETGELAQYEVTEYYTLRFAG